MTTFVIDFNNPPEPRKEDPAQWQRDIKLQRYFIGDDYRTRRSIVQTVAHYELLIDLGLSEALATAMSATYYQFKLAMDDRERDRSVVRRQTTTEAPPVDSQPSASSAEAPTVQS